MLSEKLLVLCLCLFTSAMSCSSDDNQARYDNYRLVRLTLKNSEHVHLLQELEEESDSYTFYGHALRPDQNLTVLVAAHK